MRQASRSGHFLLLARGGEEPGEEPERRVVQVDLAGLVGDRNRDAGLPVLPKLGRAVEDGAARRAAREQMREAKLDATLRGGACARAGKLVAHDRRLGAHRESGRDREREHDRHDPERQDRDRAALVAPGRHRPAATRRTTMAGRSSPSSRSSAMRTRRGRAAMPVHESCHSVPK